MNITTICPKCGKKNLASDSVIGKKVRCSNCKFEYRLTDPNSKQPEYATIVQPPKQQEYATIANSPKQANAQASGPSTPQIKFTNPSVGKRVRDYKKNQKSADEIATVLASITVFGILLFACGCPLYILMQPETEEQKLERSRRSAKAEFVGPAQQAVKLYLKDPDSAQFNWSLDDYVVTPQSDGTYLVRGSVRAQNDFGAYRRIPWQVTSDANGTPIDVQIFDDF